MTNSVTEIVGLSTIPSAERQVIINALTQREDQIADQLRSAGMQFGLYPQIVAEVVAAVGLGTEPSEEERAMIRENFVDLMRQLQAGQAPPPPAPNA